MRVVVAPDSFKGSLTAVEVCEVVASVLASRAEVAAVPIADGGEGTVVAWLAACGGERREVTVSGPYGELVRAAYGVLPDGSAVIELAAAAGLTLVAGDRPLETTTYGVGELVRHAVDGGCSAVYVGLGGSATNDGGAGIAAACGVRFLDEAGVYVPTGGTLARLVRIDASGLVRPARVVGLCDVDNPLYGPRGSAAVYGPQKGATPDQVALIDAGLAHLAAVMRRDLDVDVAEVPGAGAAGGAGAGILGLLGGELRSGIDALLDQVGFDTLLATADLVITGEGSLDEQSLQGKVVDGVARRAQQAGVPVVALAGRVAPGIGPALRTRGVTQAVAITPPGQPLAEAMAQAAANLLATVEREAPGWLRPG